MLFICYCYFWPLEQCYSMFGEWAGSISIIWELIRNAKSGPYSQAHHIIALGMETRNLCFSFSPGDPNTCSSWRSTKGCNPGSVTCGCSIKSSLNDCTLKLLTVNRGSGLVFLRLGMTPAIHLAKSEETVRRWTRISFPSQKKKKKNWDGCI